MDIKPTLINDQIILLQAIKKWRKSLNFSTQHYHLLTMVLSDLLQSTWSM